jgi:hypothetical protein
MSALFLLLPVVLTVGSSLRRLQHPDGLKAGDHDRSVRAC